MSKSPMRGIAMIRMIRAALLLIAALGATSCGGGDTSEPPGAWGSTATNTIVTAILDPAAASLDACEAGPTGALATLVTTTINPALPPNTLYLEGYGVSFTPAGAGQPPIAGATYLLPGTLPITNSPVVLLEAAAKAAYAEASASGQYPAAETSALSYLGTVTFYGTDMYGSAFGVTAYSNISLTRGPLCALGLAPAEIGVTGILNPDLDASDDITFYLTGGLPPYTVYSDYTSIIAQPGAMDSPGAFTVDPEAVFAETTVTLSVVDRVGASASALVRVRP